MKKDKFEQTVKEYNDWVNKDLIIDSKKLITFLITIIEKLIMFRKE